MLGDTVCPLVEFPCVSITEEAKRLKDLEHADAIHSVSEILSGRAEMGINQGTVGGGADLSFPLNRQHKPFKVVLRGAVE